MNGADPAASGSRSRVDGTPVTLWSLGWTLMLGACLGLIMALFTDISPLWIGALVIGAMPGLLSAAWRPNGFLRYALTGTWAMTSAVAAMLTGGLAGPLGLWCLTPLLAATAFGGGLVDGLLWSSLAVVVTGLAGLRVLPPPPHDLQGLVLSAGAAVATLTAAAAALIIARRRTTLLTKAQTTEIGELQVLLGDLPHLAVALDRHDTVYAVFGQAMPCLQHADLYGGLAVAAADADRGHVRAAFTEALDHGESEVTFTPALQADHRVVAALRRTASGGVVAVLRDITQDVEQRQAVAAALAAFHPHPARLPAEHGPVIQVHPEPLPASPVMTAEPTAPEPTAPEPALVAPAIDRTQLLSLAARLEEMRVRARESERARTRAEAALDQLQADHALSLKAVADRPVATLPETLPHDLMAKDARIAELTTQLAALETARVAAEERSLKSEQTLQARSRFLANMSHELRTPLNAIMGFSDIMRARMFGELIPKYGEYAELIHESGRHLMDLISDVLDMSKIEAERFALSQEVFDAREAVNAALRLMRVQAEEVGVNLRGVMPALPITVHADRRALKQIVLNLASNALKFTPRGGHVTVTTHAAAGVLEIAVSDTGIGIAPDDLSRLGRPFEQVGDVVRQAGGTGLGLSLVKAFAKLHGGDMSIESEVGAGTSVMVRMPVLAPLPPETPPPAPASDDLQGGQVIPLTPRTS